MLKKKLLIILSILFMNFNLDCAAAGQDPIWDELFRSMLYTSVELQDVNNVGHDYKCPICYIEISADNLADLCQANCEVVGKEHPHIYHIACLVLWINPNRSTCPLCRGDLGALCLNNISNKNDDYINPR